MKINQQYQGRVADRALDVEVTPPETPPETPLSLDPPSYPLPWQMRDTNLDRLLRWRNHYRSPVVTLDQIPQYDYGRF